MYNMCVRSIHFDFLLRGGIEVWAYKTSLAPPHFIEVPVSSGIDFASLYYFDIMDFGTVSTVRYFLFLILYLSIFLLNFEIYFYLFISFL